MHGNTSSITNRVVILAPTSPVKQWRRTRLERTRNLSYFKNHDNMTLAGKHYIPPGRSNSPGPLTSDFFQQQVAKQRNNNYHSTSLRKMGPTSVNRTALHPGGVQYVALLPCCPFFAGCTSPSTNQYIVFCYIQAWQRSHRARGRTSRDSTHRL